MSFKASAPGSLMLLGEYAVLKGYPALVCAVDKRMSVTLIPRKDNEIHLTSALGTLKTSITNISVVEPFQFVLTVLKEYQSYFRSGFDMVVEAEFSNTIGLGSSAAVTVATLSVIFAWLGVTRSPKELLQVARDIIRQVQGMGSGADVAAAVYGGILAYYPNDLHVEKFLNSYPLTVIYSGSKTPTPEAFRKVQEYFLGKEKTLTNIFEKIAQCVEWGVEAVRSQDWQALGSAMNSQQLYMTMLGTSTANIDNIIYYLRQDNTILGAKISGSGFGDCVIGLGCREKNNPINATFPVEAQITMQGVILNPTAEFSG